MAKKIDLQEVFPNIPQKLRMKKTKDGSVTYYINAKSAQRIKELKEDYDRYFCQMIESEDGDYEFSDYTEYDMECELSELSTAKETFVNALRLINLDVEEFCYSRNQDLMFGFLPLKSLEELGKYCFGELANEYELDYEAFGRRVLKTALCAYFEGLGVLFLSSKPKNRKRR